MEFYYHFASSSTSSSTSSCPPVFKNIFRQLKIKAVLGYILSTILGIFFAVVGTVCGVVTGAMIGQESDCGFLRGAAVGAVLGTLSSVEVFETFRSLWTDGKGLCCLLYLVDVLVSLGSGRLVREQVGPMMLSAVQTQMGARESSFEEVMPMDIFETSRHQGLSGDIVEMIPKVEITNKNHFDSWGERLMCSVCIQEFQLGEEVRNLPYCHHMFHQTCIDQWLVKNGSCPLCRRSLRFYNTFISPHCL